MKRFRWAVIGTGYIASNFAESMDCVPDAEKWAVVGTSREKAQRFAERHGFAKAFGSMEEMLEQGRPDAVYLATPNKAHYGLVMRAIAAGLHVLCEKPMADNRAQLQEMIQAARQANVFLMEGMWTRCFPAIRKTAEWIQQGKIGKVISVRADFGLKSAPDWQNWKASAQECAGALRDVGIYSVGMALLAFGRKPDQIDSVARLANGADTHSEMMFRYGTDGAAYLTGSFDAVTEHQALIYGENGVIVVGKRFWCPDRAERYGFDGEDIFSRRLEETFQEEYAPHGFQYEIAHVQDCVRSGRLESPWYSLAESEDMVEITDLLRKEWGVRYPSDQD